MTSRRRHRSRAAKATAAFADRGTGFPQDGGRLIATVANDITIPFFTGLMQPVDETLIAQGGSKGLAIYDEIERDTHAFAMLQKRKMALLSRAWEVAPGGDRPIDQEAAQLVEEELNRLPFDRICEGLLDATLKGFAVSEIVWIRDGARIRPETIVSHDPRRFAFDDQWKPRLLTYAKMREGEMLPERKFITHRVGVKGNNPYGIGLGSRLFWPVLFKREGVTFWLHFLEKFAGPTVVAKTPWGTVSDEQRRLMSSLHDIRTSSAITVPIGTDIEFLEASRTGSVTYEQFLGYWDRQISICVTGETLTTEVGDAGGSRALGEVHQEMMELLIDTDADLLSDTLRDSLLRWLIELNLPGAAVPRIWRIRPRNEKAAAETRAARAAAADAANRALVAIITDAAAFDDDRVAREYITSFDLTDGLSDQTIDAMVAARRAMVTPAGRSQPVGFAEGGDTGPETGPSGTGPDTGNPLDPAIGAMIDRIEAMLGAAGSLPEFAEMLRAGFPDIDDLPLVEALAASLMAAQIEGREAIADGNG